jgi:hypothetical protein
LGATGATNYLYVDYNTKLANLAADGITEIGSTLRLDNNGELIAIGLTAPTSVAGNLTVSSNTSLPTSTVIDSWMLGVTVTGTTSV